MNRKFTYIAMSFIMALQSVLAEEENSTSDEAKIDEIQNTNQESLYALNDLTVTASRFDYDPLKTPVNSTYIDSEKLRDSPFSNVVDAITKYGNVNFRSVVGSNSSGDLSMRGFGENSQTRILVMVDGQKLTRADMGAINWLQIPLSDVESIEIIRGPQSALYGSTAEAGVIKITTLRAKEDGVDVSSQLYYGSYGTYNTSLNVRAREGAYSLTTDVSYYNTDGWRQNSASDSFSVNLSLGYDINENNTFLLTGNFSETSTTLPGPLTYEQYLADPTQSNYDGSTYFNSDEAVITATIKNISNIGEGEIAYGMNVRGIYSTLGGNSNNSQYTHTFTPRYKFELNDEFNAIVGFDATYDDIYFYEYYGDTSIKQSYADVTRLSLSPYIGGDYSPIEELKFSFVGRYEGINNSVNNTAYITSTLSPTITVPGLGTIPNPNYSPEIDSSQTYNKSKWMNGFAGNFGTNWNFRKDSSLYFKFDQIYHYPTTDEIASYQGGGLSVAFNDDLRPETGQNYEIGIKHFSGNWTLNSSVFLMDLTDEISYAEYEDSEGNLYWLNTNLPPTIRYGVDFELNYDSKYWGIGAMVAVVNAQFTEGTYADNQVPLVPNYHGNITAYVKPLEWIILSARITGLSSQYVGSDYENATAQIPAYALLDFQINFKCTRYTTLFFSIENALDKQYISAAWASGYYPGMGRMMKVGLNLKF